MRVSINTFGVYFEKQKIMPKYNILYTCIIP